MTDHDHDAPDPAPGREHARRTALAILHDLENRFTYHAPLPGQPERYGEIRATALEYARRLAVLCPSSRELSLAFTKLEEAVFWANASIARNGERRAPDETTPRFDPTAPPS